MVWLLIGYLIQLVLCYLMIRCMYIWDDITPVGLLVVYAFIPGFGLAAEFIVFLLEYFAQREYEHDWDNIWKKIFRIND